MINRRALLTGATLALAAPPVRAASVRSQPLRSWIAARTRVLSGSGNAKLLCLGDSTTAGMGNSIAVANGLSNSYPTRLTADLTAGGISARLMNMGDGNSASISNLISYDPRNAFSSQTGYSIQAGSLGDGMVLIATTATTRWIKSFAGTWDTIEIVYLKSNTASLPVYINGGATPVSTISVVALGLQPATVTISVTRGVNATVEIGPPITNSVYVVAVNVYDSQTKQCLVYNCGWSGGKAANIDDTTNAYSYAKMVQYMAPDISIINIGINDYASTALSAYLASFSDIITKARAFGDVVVCIPTPTANALNMQEFRQHMIELAASSGCLLIDLQRFWPQGLGPEVIESRRQGLINVDNTHPTVTGYQTVGDVVSAQLLAA